MDHQEKPLNPLFAYVAAFVDELRRSGLRHVVICPGSRSTPLAMAFAQNGGIRIWMHVDERSAGFFALGMAKALREPVAIVVTSGTAAANLYPAVVEAHLTHVPLLLLTADRPPELRENGAPQTIDQNHLFGAQVKWYAESALPENSESAHRYIRTLACRAFGVTQDIPAGPVHLNMPFREPLVPEYVQDEGLAHTSVPLYEGRLADAPYVQVNVTRLGVPLTGDIMRLAEMLAAAPRGLIIAGPMATPELADHVRLLARQLHYPILADPLSGLRTTDDPLVISAYDAMLRIEPFAARMTPSIIMRYGAMPTAKTIMQYLNRHAQTPVVVIDGTSSWPEPTRLAAQVIHADPVVLTRHLNAVLPDMAIVDQHVRANWLTIWQRIDAETRVILSEGIRECTEPFEGRVFIELAHILPPATTLFVGNSMPIRDLDTFFWSRQIDIQIAGNRGANGIDGLVSTALGMSAAQPERHVVLVLGDLSLFHDMNGLLAAKLHHLHATIIVINNNGGGIFSFLPQATFPEHFEQLFGTPIDLPIETVASLYTGTYSHPANWEAFRTAVQQSRASDGLHIIEVRTQRERNVALHAALWRQVQSVIVQHMEEHL